jgi:hypothetical protein
MKYAKLLIVRQPFVNIATGEFDVIAPTTIVRVDSYDSNYVKCSLLGRPKLKARIHTGFLGAVSALELLALEAE